MLTDGTFTFKGLVIYSEEKAGGGGGGGREINLLLL